MRTKTKHLLSTDTVETLLERKNGSTLRQLAVNLGYPESYNATLSDVLAGKAGKLTLDAENDLRRRMGLPVIAMRRALACPSCGQVHGEGLDCGGREVVAVAILAPGQRVTAECKAGPPRRRTLSVSGATAEQRQQRAELGVSWADVVAAGLQALAESAGG